MRIHEFFVNFYQNSAFTFFWVLNKNPKIFVRHWWLNVLFVLSLYRKIVNAEDKLKDFQIRIIDPNNIAEIHQKNIRFILNFFVHHLMFKTSWDYVISPGFDFSSQAGVAKKFCEKEVESCLALAHTRFLFHCQLSFQYQTFLNFLANSSTKTFLRLSYFLDFFLISVCFLVFSLENQRL